MQCFLNFPYCYRRLLDKISHSLTQKETPEKEFKVQDTPSQKLSGEPIQESFNYHGYLLCFQGTLYVVLGSGKRCLATKRSWMVIGQLWPAIVQAQQSEKPSILRVVDDIIARISKNLESPGIETKVRFLCTLCHLFLQKQRYMYCKYDISYIHGIETMVCVLYTPYGYIHF